ncbi:MAG: TatD family deoxyribonuclease [Actinobacteria bacterium]|nr:MAG: TatD family deoxyribonuclease [Actinomycetota bacterium]
MSPGNVDLPVIGARSADTHAHLDMLDDPAGALERAALAGTTFVVTVVDPTENAGASLDSVQAWADEANARLVNWAIPDSVPPEVRVIVGVHPHNSRHYDESVRALITEFAALPVVTGIGEIGLDFHYDHSPRADQVSAFSAQLELARQFDLPAVVHLREAHEEGIALMREVGLPDAGCVLHCFTGGPALVAPFLELGCHISFAGPLTFRRAADVREALLAVPLDRVLFETDCPFMAPEPLRGRTNEPAWVTLTITKAAEVRGEPAEVVSLAALENARRLFGGPERA